jgi:hypothetical protein
VGIRFLPAPRTISIQHMRYHMEAQKKKETVRAPSPSRSRRARCSPYGCRPSRLLPRGTRIYGCAL